MTADWRGSLRYGIAYFLFNLGVSRGIAFFFSPSPAREAYGMLSAFCLSFAFASYLRPTGRAVAASYVVSAVLLLATLYTLMAIGRGGKLTESPWQPAVMAPIMAFMIIVPLLATWGAFALTKRLRPDERPR